MDIERFWAKTAPFQSVLTHARISGFVAQILVSELLSAGVRAQLSSALSLNEKELVDFVGYLVSVHDISKLEYSFQAQNEELRQALEHEPQFVQLPVDGVRHEKTGQHFLHAYWRQNGENRESANLFSKIVGAHHQGKSGSGHYEQGSQWQNVRSSLEEKIRKPFCGGAIAGCGLRCYVNRHSAD